MFLLRVLMIVLLASETFQHLPIHFSGKSEKFNSSKSTLNDAGINTVYIWDLTTGQLKRSLNFSQAYVMSIAAFENGIIAVGYTQYVLFWNYLTGHVKQTYEDTYGYVINLGAQRIAVNAIYNGTVNVYNVTSGEKMYSFNEAKEGDDLFFWSYPVMSLSNNRLLVVYGHWIENMPQSKSLVIYELEKGVKKFSLNFLTDAVTSIVEIKTLGLVAFETNGYALPGNYIAKVLILDLDAGEIAYTFDSSYLLYSLERERLLVVQDSLDFSLNFVDTANGFVKFSLTGHTAKVNAMVKLGGGSLCASTEINSNQILIWNITTDGGSLVFTLNENYSDVLYTLRSLDNNLLAVGLDTEIRIWNMTNGQIQYTLDQFEPDTLLLNEILTKLEDNYLATSSEYNIFVD